MYDVITFGSATRDTFLILKKEECQILKEEGQQRLLCFPFGSKISVEDMQVFSGGGGTNTACTFTNQGFKTAYVGKIGKDKRGEAVIDDLKRFNVDTSLVKRDGNHPTAYSVMLSLLQGDRTILVSKGACHFLKKQDIEWEKIKHAKWFYLAPLSEESAQVFEALIDFAKENKIRVAVNLGHTQLEFSSQKLKSILSKIEILILNKEEAFSLVGTSFENDKELASKAFSFLGDSKKERRLLVVTKGREGSFVFDGQYLFEASTPSVLPFEKTGAGDAYGSGFLAGLMQRNDIEYAIQLATANATSCVQKIGAKNGLLKKGEWGKWPKVKVKKIKL